MITAEQVTALTAQAKRAATYNAFDETGNLLPDWQIGSSGTPIYLGSLISTRGVGIYGQTPVMLTVAGFLKPGTLELITTPDMTLTVLNTRSVWTGQQGINSLVDYLDDPVLQNLTQIELMQSAYTGLIDTGILIGTESAKYQATFLQPATRYGVDAVISWINNTASPELVSQIKVAARQGQYAIDFVDTYSAVLNTGVDVPGFANTVNRTEIDQAVTDIVGNPKIPALEFADQVVTAPLDQVSEEGLLRFAPGKPRG